MNARRESMEYDVVIVGGGPAGLAAAIRLKQLAATAGRETRVCLIEKGSQIGAHILSGAIFDPQYLTELIPDWKAKAAPLETPVTAERMLFLTRKSALGMPRALLPRFLRNDGQYIVSLGNLCQWLAGEAERLGVEIYPGFVGGKLLYGEDGAVRGVVTGDFGIDRDGLPGKNFAPGMELRAGYVLLAEGTRGFLTSEVIARHGLDAGRGPQKYAIGIKELWEVPPEKHQPGLALHTLGWPLDNRTGGGGFLYHWGRRQCSVGLVVHLDYRNPGLSPFEEFQRFKSHPAIRAHLAGGKRVGYGARTISEGGFQSVPRLVFPGGALVGDAAGFMDVPRLQGAHNAIASGMLAAEAAFVALAQGRRGDVLDGYETRWRQSRMFRELRRGRNFKPLWERFGRFPGILLAGCDLWANYLLGFVFFGTLRHAKPDCAGLKYARDCRAPVYVPPDGLVTFDLASSVYLSNTNHREDQPPHLRLADPSLPLRGDLPEYGEAVVRVCPAGVYEIIGRPEAARFHIDAVRCVHCKACDIKDPSQNIRWVPPEGGGGPNYSDM
jgi:electron-transferring-flavoprotein dehydrogenase